MRTGEAQLVNRDSLKLLEVKELRSEIDSLRFEVNKNLEKIEYIATKDFKKPMI